MTDNAIAQKVVDAAFKIHTHPGSGRLRVRLCRGARDERGKRGFGVRTQVALPLAYEDVFLEFGFRIDLLVAERVIVEVKSVEALAGVHHKQLLTYLRPTDKRLGLLVNFNSAVLKGNMKRVVNGLEE